MRPYVLFVLTAIIMAVTALAGNASAQEVTIETSADSHSNRFFGEGAVRVVIEDESTDDSASDTIEVEIDVEGTGGAFTVSDTSDGSQRFEFFIMHVDSFLNDTAGGYPDLDGTADSPAVVTFGGAGADLVTGDGLFVDAAIEIGYGDETVAIDYEETAGAVDLDRDSYGTTSFVYISVVDQDANLNPTGRDEFTVDPDMDPNDDLLALGGGSFEDAVVFTETGDNTAVFEGRYRLGVSMLADSESLELTLFDKANYGATLAAPENDSNNTDEVSFTVGDSGGTLDVGGGQQAAPTWDPTIDTDKDSYALGESVHVTVADQDANVNSGAADSIRLFVSSGGSEIEVPAVETGANTGMFEASFQLAEETDAASGAISPGGSATITYTDEQPADYSEKVQAGENPEKDFTLEIDVQLPARTGVEATDVTAPAAEDVSGGSGPYAVGDSVTLSTSVSNNNDEPQQFVALIEVRDSNGATVFLALQGGTLDPSGSTDIGVLWQPGQAGTFEVRTFVVSHIGAEVEVLSPVAVSEITVSQAQ
jgi:hypothetical protein